MRTYSTMIQLRTGYPRDNGFTLVELAVVLIIVALLSGGLMMTLSTQQEIQRLIEVRRQMADIREALLGFAIINGHLPRPAAPTIASGSANAGIASTTLTSGVLPWATLGLPETDPWGQRFTYSVHSGFTSTFALTTSGNIVVKESATVSVNLADSLPAIVISHGRNGRGGYRSIGAQVAGALGDEAENANADATFVSRPHTPDFDDEAIWVPLPILMSRMIAAGRLP